MERRKKRKNLILGLVVAIVWGSVIFRFVSELGDSSDVTLPPAQMVKNTGLEVKRKNYRLYADYPDPFLKDEPINVENTPEKLVFPDVQYRRRNQQLPAFARQQPQVAWPHIVFCGLVAQSDKSKILGMIQVDKIKRLVQEGDSLQQLKIIGLTPDSLVVRFRSIRKSFGTSNLNAEPGQPDQVSGKEQHLGGY